MRIPITEESGVHKAWKEEAEQVDSISGLTVFVNHLMEDYEHDYGTICHAIVAAMTATYKLINSSPQGGITGFQASCIGWEMVSLFMGKTEGGRRMLNNNDLLFPQNADKFRTISTETAAWIKEEARLRIRSADKLVHPDVLAHWKRIAEGEIPFGLSVAEND